MRPASLLRSFGLAALTASCSLLPQLLAQASPYASLPADSRIQDLTSTAAFDTALLRAGRQTPLLLVHVHGRCSACGAVAPAFIAAAERARDAREGDAVLRDVEWGRVDGRANEGLLERYGILGNSPQERTQPHLLDDDDDDASSDASEQAREGGDGDRKGIRGYPILLFTQSSAEPTVLSLDQDDGGGGGGAGPSADLEGKVSAILEAARHRIRSLSPVQSSAAVVEAAVKERVLALNADTFHGVVMAEDKDVFVKFYAPWCSHCKKLAPRYAKVAALFAEHPTCLVTTFNADPPAERAIARDHKIRGFPTLKFYPSKTNSRTNWTKAEPEVYRGQRSPEALLAFLNERCGTELVLPTWQEEWGAKVDAWKTRVGALFGAGAGGEDKAEPAAVVLDRKEL
ncbi:hypothetical protein OC834_002659 [Tilletia horrida]|nr:hypothetical protein OC834_002659 [Tilletia horrida]